MRICDLPMANPCSPLRQDSHFGLSAFADGDAKPTKETKEQIKSLAKEIDGIRIATPNR
jgi:hypothetical protein